MITLPRLLFYSAAGYLALIYAWPWLHGEGFRRLMVEASLLPARLGLPMPMSALLAIFGLLSLLLWMQRR